MLQERNNQFYLFNNASVINESNDDNSQAIPVTIGLPLDEHINKPTKNKFIFKTLTYLLFQLLFTFISTLICYSYKDTLLKYIYVHEEIIILNTIIFIICVFVFACCNIKNNIVLHSLFIIFTITSSFYVSYITIHYNIIIILQAGFTTSLIVILTTIYSLYCYSYDQEFYISIGLLINFTFIVIGMTFIGLYFPYNSIISFVLLLIFIVLFTLYLFYDLMLLYDKNNELIFYSPIHACLNLYLDIINIFIELIRIFYICNANN